MEEVLKKTGQECLRPNMQDKGLKKNTGEVVAHMIDSRENPQENNITKKKLNGWS